MADTVTNPIEVTRNNQQDEPRIYVADLKAYVAGTIHGRWIDAHQDAEDLHAEIQALLAESPEAGSEEFALHDYEGFGSASLDEYESLEDVAALAALVVEHGEDLASAVWNHTRGDIDECKRIIEEDYLGCFDDLEDWAIELFENTGELDALPARLRSYFDFAAFARDCNLSGDIYSVDATDGRGVHVFSNR